jgi:hypothetical protein
MQDDFSKYESMRRSGASPAQVNLEAVHDNLDRITRIRLIRTVFSLTLGEAKEVLVVSEGWATSLDQHLETIAQQIEKMFPEIPRNFKWVVPWEAVNDADAALVKELKNEVPPGHPLYGIPVMAVARRIDNDDVLFATADPSKPFALVHLAWSGPETDPRWPSTGIFKSWRERIDYGLLPTHDEYVAGSND